MDRKYKVGQIAKVYIIFWQNYIWNLIRVGGMFLGVKRLTRHHTNRWNQYQLLTIWVRGLTTLYLKATFNFHVYQLSYTVTLCGISIKPSRLAMNLAVCFWIAGPLKRSSPWYMLNPWMKWHLIEISRNPKWIMSDI